MKTKLICLLLFYSVISSINAQSLSPEEKIEIINSLSITELDSMFTIHYAPNAIQAIIEYVAEDSIDFHEAIPAIVENIWKVSPYDQTEFLWALYLLNASETEPLALAFIDSVDHYTDTLFTRINLKLLTLNILLKLGNYSKYQLVFDELAKENPEISSTLISMLSTIIQNIPSEEERARNALIKVAEEDGEDTFRYQALTYLIDIYGVGLLPFFIERFIIDEYSAITVYLHEFLVLHKDGTINSAFKVKLPSIIDEFIRFEMINDILTQYGSLSDYKYIFDYKNSGIDPQNQDRINNLLINFTPLKPESSSSIIELINNLYNLTDTIQTYIWLGDLTFADSLKTKLNQAKTYLLSGDSLSCAVQVKSFKDLVDNVYKDSLNPDTRFVTIEGWKFLYWNAQYILGRLPAIPIVVAADIEIINPAMSMKNPGAFTMEVKGSGFTSSSVVYFKGNARATTFVSDSILNAAILAADVSAVGNFPVWVSDGTTNSDTLVFKVVNNLPKEILPIINCVKNNGNGTYTAYFGYDNKNSVSVYVPIYSQNKISPNPWDRGQPGVFKVGIWEKVFSVTFTSGNIIWHLNNKIATAKRTSPPCN